MKRINLLSIAFLLCSLSTYAQFDKVKIDANAANSHQVVMDIKKSPIMVEESVKEANINQNLPQWNQSVINFEKKHEFPESVRRVKEEKTKSKIVNRRDTFPDEYNPELIVPDIGVNFRANLFDGATPPDNSMAISFGGKVVTVTNSHIFYYDNTGQLLKSSSFADFFDDPLLTGNLYDPVVLFDSGNNRFFMVVLHGSTSSSSKVIVCFSQSSDPMDGWWYYKLTGNPLNNGCWFDYPKIGVSTNEVYVTGNLFNNSDVFQQSVIYQMTKSDGYNGNSLNWQYWNNISATAFTLVPASYGLLGNYGPGIYFISTYENGASDKYYLYDLTDDMTGDPEINVYTINASFSLAGDAMQLGTDILMDVGETRGLSAFYLNGKIHFVHNAEYADSYSGIKYNRLTVSSLSNWSSTFGLDGFDYTYPSVASFAETESDKSVMICFLRSGSSIYPQTRVVLCDNAGTWSGSSLVKAGETYVDVYASDGVTRWGDYSGISRKQNSSNPEVWLSGCYGVYRSSEHALDTWIAQIKGMTTDVQDNPQIKQKAVNVFPNPVYDMINIEFYLDQKGFAEISLIDLQGKLVKLLYKDLAAVGKNMVSFNKGALTPGIYFIKIQSENKMILNEKIIIE